MSTYIAPCPFCDEAMCGVNFQNEKYHVHCDFCSAEGPKSTIRKDAIDAWNNKPIQKPKVNIFLPENDPRFAKVHWSEMKNGMLDLCISVSSEPHSQTVDSKLEVLNAFQEFLNQQKAKL